MNTTYLFNLVVSCTYSSIYLIFQMHRFCIPLKRVLKL